MCSASVVKREPLLLRADAHPALDYLPGGWCEIHVAPSPKWPVVHRNVSALHGMVTALLREPHHHTKPRFVLAPWPDGVGWRVYAHDLTVGLRAAGRTHDATLYRRPVLARFSPLRRVKAPHVEGWTETRVVVLDTMSPVCVRAGNSERGAGKKFCRTSLTAGNLVSTLGSWAPRVIGYEIEDEPLAIEIVMAEVRTAKVHMGSKLGAVTGVAGKWVLRANGPARWLLRVCETIGLGGRVAFGFGQIRVTEC